MESPFPGMDPFIEGAGIWQDFHQDLASEIRTQLNQQITPGYFAGLIPHMVYDTIEIATLPSSPRPRPQIIQPDVGVFQNSPFPSGRPAVMELDAPSSQGKIRLDVQLRWAGVEVRDAKDGTLITAIEILSPVNKRPGHKAQIDYLRKRRDIFRTQVHLIEIDLLRGGERLPLDSDLPEAPYYVFLSREEQRPFIDIWAVQLQSRLPRFPVPLRHPDPDAKLDLDAAVKSVYQRGAYRTRINYRNRVPAPPLSPEQAAWVETLLATQHHPN